MLVSTFVSPQLNGSLPNVASLQNTPDTVITQQVMTAPKSPHPKQKKPSSELPSVFQKIAFCESGDRQFDEDGNVVHGLITPHDTGRYQINKLIWADTAKKMGYDLDTEEGNEAMALLLYKSSGTKPWRSSQKCWDKPAQVVADN